MRGKLEKIELLFQNHLGVASIGDKYHFKKSMGDKLRETHVRCIGQVNASQ